MAAPDYLDLKPDDFQQAIQSATNTANAAQALLTEKKWLFEKRLEYARYFFDHHAKQRMSMFNYFLVFVGFIVTGYAGLFKDSNIPAANFLAAAGVLLTIAFICLERRNEELVHISEDVLGSLETEMLFDGYNREVQLPRRRNLLGWMRTRDRKEWGLGIFRRQSKDQNGEYGRSLYEHGIWMPVFQYLILMMFACLAGYSHWHTIYKCLTPF